jgi:glycosyltransferase involved in cell wall biosynthesis
MKFKKTIIDRARLGVAWRNFTASLRQDLANDFLRPMVPESWRNAVRKKSSPSPTRTSVRKEKPVIFVSYATDESLKGSHRYCGGEKLLNNLVILLRRHGYEAFMVSLDGKDADWLAEHAPFLSIEEFAERKKAAGDIRCVTSWVQAKAFLDHCPEFYFWDQELGASARSHFPQLASLMADGRILQTAGVNRVVQTWHSTVFGREAHILRQLVDEHHWIPDPSRRQHRRVGYFDEGSHGAEYIRIIREITSQSGLELEFHELRGSEKEIIDQMQTCGVFLALNIGKSPWGEGGPMTPQEAMACGTVPICFDLKGAWELIQQNFNGVITDEIRPELMAKALVEIYNTPGRLEEMSRRCLEITATSHTMESRWDAVVRFLELPECGE